MLHRRLCLPASLLPRARAYCSQRTCTSSADRSPHTPVLLAEVVAAFHGTRLRTHVDCTLGAGGHALAIAEDHPELVTLLGVDVDPEAHRLAQPRLAGLQEHRGFAWHPVQGNFGDLPALLAAELPSGVLQHGVDGVRMDVGVSSMQLDTPERGFRHVLVRSPALACAHASVLAALPRTGHWTCAWAPPLSSVQQPSSTHGQSSSSPGAGCAVAGLSGTSS